MPGLCGLYGAVALYITVVFGPVFTECSFYSYHVDELGSSLHGMKKKTSYSNANLLKNQ